MNIGQLLVFAGFILSAVTSVAYYWDARNRLPLPAVFSPTRLFYGVLALSAVASVVLWYLIFTHEFQYSYVAEFSSRTQPMLYQVSAFWAGQEGTFLLWALMTAVMGIFFLRRGEGNDGYSMSVVSAFLAFLYLLMIVRSPFATTPATIPHRRSVRSVTRIVKEKTPSSSWVSWVSTSESFFLRS